MIEKKWEVGIHPGDIVITTFPRREFLDSLYPKRGAYGMVVEILHEPTESQPWEIKFDDQLWQIKEFMVLMFDTGNLLKYNTNTVELI